jgi:hypothetical protein
MLCESTLHAGLTLYLWVAKLRHVLQSATCDSGVPAESTFEDEAKRATN